tara:strand:+ start:334 stop:609 length:276 start_codon:yes stop_codon:yes gene_type:complete
MSLKFVLTRPIAALLSKSYHFTKFARLVVSVYLHDIVNFINEYDYNIFVIKPAGLLPLDFSPFTENRYSYINFLLVKNSIQDELKDLILKR